MFQELPQDLIFRGKRMSKILRFQKSISLQNEDLGITHKATINDRASLVFEVLILKRLLSVPKYQYFTYFSHDLK